jgi:hypothetical protein
MAEEYKKRGEKGRNAVEKKKGLRLDRWLACLQGERIHRPDAWPARATRRCRQVRAQLPPRLEQSRPVRMCFSYTQDCENISLHITV